MSNDKLKELLDWVQENKTESGWLYKDKVIYDLDVELLEDEIQSLINQPVQTQSDTDVGQWQAGDRIIIHNNNLKINHLYIISELESNNSCTVLTLSQRVQLGFSGKISDIKPTQKTLLFGGFDRSKEDPNDVYNIDAERRTMQAEIDRLKAQVEGFN